MFHSRHPGIRRFEGEWFMRISLKLALLAAFVVASSSVNVTLGAVAPVRVGPTLSSIGPLAFGPDGMLFAADRQAATIYALNLGAQGSSARTGTADVAAITGKIAAML